jgi:hypothetical protein
MKLPVIETLCIVALSGAISAAYADEGKDESGKGREKGRYSFEKDRRHERSRHREAGTMTIGKMTTVDLTFMSMAIPILKFLRAIIRLRANAVSGILIARPGINRLPETAVVFLPVPG